MDERTQHHHRCVTTGCEVSWTCFRADCDPHAFCDACDRAQFEAYMEQRGFMESQPTFSEVAQAVVAAHKEMKHDR